MKKNPWVGSRIFEIFYWGTLSIVLFVFAFRFFRNVLSAVLLTAVVILFRTLYSVFAQRKPFDSKLYQFPILECEGEVLEKHIYGYLGSSFLREYIIFATLDGQQIKLYVPDPGVGDSRMHILCDFNVGDKGTVYYRSGKKHKYFQYFEKPRLELEDFGD